MTVSDLSEREPLLRHGVSRISRYTTESGTNFFTPMDSSPESSGNDEQDTVVASSRRRQTRKSLRQPSGGLVTSPPVVSQEKVSCNTSSM